MELRFRALAANFVINGVKLFPLIAPTAVTHVPGSPDSWCIKTLLPDEASDLAVKCRTQVFIFLPGDIVDIKALISVDEAAETLARVTFAPDAGLYRLGKGEVLTCLPEELRQARYVHLTHEKLAGLNETRDFFSWINTSKAETAEDAVQMVGFGIQFIATPYLKIEIRDSGLMTKNDEVVKAVQWLVDLNKMLRVLPLIGKNLPKGMLVDLMAHDQVVGLRVEGTQPGSGQGLGSREEKDKIRRVIGWAREIRPDVQLIAECGIGKPQDAQEAIEMGFNAVLVNTAITQASHPVDTALGFVKVLEELFHK